MRQENVRVRAYLAARSEQPRSATDNFSSRFPSIERETERGRENSVLAKWPLGLATITRRKRSSLVSELRARLKYKAKLFILFFSLKPSLCAVVRLVSMIAGASRCERRKAPKGLHGEHRAPLLLVLFPQQIKHYGVKRTSKY